MIKNHIAVQLPIAILLGLAAVLSMAFFWGLYATYSPFLSWMIESPLLRGNATAYYTIVYTLDALINVALACPFAVLFRYLYEPKVGWWFVLAAVLTMFVWSYQLVLFSGDAVNFFLDHAPQSLAGAAMLVGSLPVAYLLVRWLWPGQSHAAA